MKKEPKEQLKRLTKIQRSVFNIFVKIINDNGNPTLELIKKKMNTCSRRETIWHHIVELCKKGYIKKEEGKYKPTSEGLEQFIMDSNNPDRIKSSWKNKK